MSKASSADAPSASRYRGSPRPHLRSWLTFRVLGGLLALSLLLTAPPASMINADPADQAEENQECCFTNPKYAGVCEVDPAEGETCASILEYLNNPNSAGKTYCEATLIRVGWKQTVCEKEDEDKDDEDQD